MSLSEDELPGKKYKPESHLETWFHDTPRHGVKDNRQCHWQLCLVYFDL